MLDTIHDALEKDEYAIGIFIDSRKAFETVDHRILLHKLYHSGIQGVAYGWFCDYLRIEHSWFSTTIFNLNMRIFHIILGPLFLIYINDMAIFPQLSLYYLLMTLIRLALMMI